MQNLNENRLKTLARWLLGYEDTIPEGISDSRIDVAQELFERLFFCAPVVELNEEKISAFNEILEAHLSDRKTIDLHYTLPYPKWEFLHYLTSNEKYLLHGSSRARIDQLKPGPQSDWSGKPIKAVFATSDPIWSIFFATLNTKSLGGSIRNGGFLVEASNELKRYYFFSVHAASELAKLWTQGTVHIIDRKDFTSNSVAVRFDEWHHLEPVPVTARIDVNAEDFPFSNSVSAHQDGETVHQTWLLYKTRLKENL